MEELLSAGEALLSRSPASAEEIGRAGQEARGLVGRLDEVAKVSHLGWGDDRLLAGVHASVTP